MTKIWNLQLIYIKSWEFSSSFFFSTLIFTQNISNFNIPLDRGFQTTPDLPILLNVQKSYSDPKNLRNE